MTKIASILFCSLLGGIFVIGAYLIQLGSSALAFEPAHQSLVVKIKKDKDKPKNCKKARCEPGMFVLDKPNIYGACCQATAAPLTPKTAPAEPVKCKFPGEVPPDCNCPKGTEFMGNKGCLPQRPSWWCQALTEPGFSWGQSFTASSEAVARGMFISEMERQKKKITSEVKCKL